MSKAKDLTRPQLEATLHVRTRERDVLGRRLAKAQDRIKALEDAASEYHRAVVGHLTQQGPLPQTLGRLLSTQDRLLSTLERREGAEVCDDS